jgi:hypothetical protein
MNKLLYVFFISSSLIAMDQGAPKVDFNQWWNNNETRVEEAAVLKRVGNLIRTGEIQLSLDDRSQIKREFEHIGVILAKNKNDRRDLLKIAVDLHLKLSIALFIEHHIGSLEEAYDRSQWNLAGEEFLGFFSDQYAADTIEIEKLLEGALMKENPARWKCQVKNEFRRSCTHCCPQKTSQISKVVSLFKRCYGFNE